MKKFIITVPLVAVLIGCKKKDETPVACFELSTETIFAGEPVQFSNCSDDAFQIEWNFGDGESSDIRNPSHVFENRGNYEVQMTAYGTEANVFDTYTQEVQVHERIMTHVKIKPILTNGHPFVGFSYIQDGFSRYLPLSYQTFENGVHMYEVSSATGYVPSFKVDYREYDNPDCLGAPTVIRSVNVSPNMMERNALGDEYTYVDVEGFEVTFVYTLQ